MRFVVAITLFCLSTLSSQADPPNNLFTGSTPADSEIKSLLNISESFPAEFIRWQLFLNSNKTYQLTVHYGVGLPNTLGFKYGGRKSYLSGSYELVSQPNQVIIRLKKRSKFLEPIQLLKLNENLLHILTGDLKLMVGNGGWSYTLNRKTPLPNNEVTCVPGIRGHKFREVVYEGRTPCLEISDEYHMGGDDNCFKLKWKLTLFRNPYTKEPSTYLLSRTLERSHLIRGKWRVINDSLASKTIIELDPDKPDQSIKLLAGDENVLFFLDKNGEMFTGNDDFSYTLNRRRT
jgi:hypothetical protein